LKAAFLGKYKEDELKLQVLCDPVMENGEVKKVISLSDSRDCTKHWLISDTGLVDLLKRGRQPVIAASSWYMDLQGDQPTLNIERYIFLTEEQEDRIGRPDPIKSHFYNYVRNEQMGGVNPADKFLPKRCKVCRGCLSTPCRPVAKVRCEACIRNDKWKCVRRKCDVIEAARVKVGVVEPVTTKSTESTSTTSNNPTSTTFNNSTSNNSASSTSNNSTNSTFNNSTNSSNSISSSAPSPSTGDLLFVSTTSAFDTSSTDTLSENSLLPDTNSIARKRKVDCEESVGFGIKLEEDVVTVNLDIKVKEELIDPDLVENVQEREKKEPGEVGGDLDLLLKIKQEL